MVYSARNSGSHKMKREKFNILLLGIFLLLFSLLPHFVSSYYVYILTEVFILAIMGYSFRILFSAGYLSLAIAGLYATGAYTFALLYFNISKSLYIPFLGALISSGIIATLIGFFSVKRERMYFAVLTFAFSELIHAIMWQWRGLFGGDEGISGIVKPPIDLYFFQISLKPYINYYYFTLAILIVCAFSLKKIQNSHFGYILRSIRDNPERAVFVGVKVQNHVLVAFIISGILAGLAGALYVCLAGAVDPGLAHIINTVEPQIATMIGGVFALSGPVVGSLIYTFLKAYLITKFGNWLLLIGALLIALVLLFRRGVLGYLADKLGWEL
jgi:branched-chain amino acid transport system permease protein